MWINYRRNSDNAKLSKLTTHLSGTNESFRI